MRELYLLVVAIHLLAAAGWVGGSLFLALAVIPGIRQPQFRPIMPDLLDFIGRRARTLGWGALGTLVVTGVIILLLRGIGPATFLDPAFWKTGFAHTLGSKFAAAGLVLILTALHDFGVGVRANELARKDPTSAEARRLRRLAIWFARVNLGLAILIVGLSVILVRGL